MSRKFSPPPDRHPRKPRIVLPRGACDCHFHVFGPQALFPLHPDRKIDVEDATYEQFLHMQEMLGFERGLLVVSALHFYGYDQLVHLLCRDPERLRGVAILQSDVTDKELDLLGEAGVVGARFYPDLDPNLDERLLARVHERGWSAHFLIRGEERAKAWRAPILASHGPIVVEHAGWQPPSAGLDGEGFRIVLEMLDTGRCWVKLSPRMSDQPTLPFSDCLPFIRELIRRAPDRMLWGSDWPHPNYFNPMPNDADLVDMLLDWAPDEGVRHRILVDNPADLFGFPESPALHRLSA